MALFGREWKRRAEKKAQKSKGESKGLRKGDEWKALYKRKTTEKENLKKVKRLKNYKEIKKMKMAQIWQPRIRRIENRFGRKSRK